VIHGSTKTGGKGGSPRKKKGEGNDPDKGTEGGICYHDDHRRSRRKVSASKKDSRKKRKKKKKKTTVSILNHLKVGEKRTISGIEQQ